VSRTASLLPLIVLPPARASGAGYAASAPTAAALRIAALVAFICACLPLLAGASLSRVIAACLLAALAAYGITALARRQIGGQTGDVAGAAQQAAEIAVLLVFSAGGVV
jgi:adenosylcobinamide-GDP ribazoletransferase